MWTGTKLYVQTARTKWAERTATLIKTARLEHASDSCFGMSILLCWSRGGLGNAHTVTVGKSLGCTCPVAMWLCGCVAALLCSVPFQMNLHPIESTMAPWPCHSLVCQLPTVLLVSSDTPTSSMSPSMKIAFSEVFFSLGSLCLLWDLLPQLSHFRVVLVCLSLCFSHLSEMRVSAAQT